MIDWFCVSQVPSWAEVLCELGWFYVSHVPQLGGCDILAHGFCVNQGVCLRGCIYLGRDLAHLSMAWRLVDLSGWIGFLLTTSQGSSL